MSDWQTREIERLRRGLEAIRRLQNKTLLGMSDDGDAERSHRLGAVKAFNQAAELATAVLETPESFSDELLKAKIAMLRASLGRIVAHGKDDKAILKLLIDAVDGILESPVLKKSLESLNEILEDDK